MRRTTLGFYRKPQTLANVEHERPKSLSLLRQLAKTTLDEIEVELELAERAFYKGKDLKEDILAVVPHVRRIMLHFGVPFIRSVIQLEDIEMQIVRTEDDRVKERLAKELVPVLEYNKKLMDFVPGEFQPIIDSLKHVRDVLEKYCRSFYQGNDDSYIVSAKQYDNRREAFKKTLQSKFDNIAKMPQSYRKILGLEAAMFGLDSNDLALQLSIPELPFLLVCPETCSSIRECIQILRRWIEEDEDYLNYIKEDMKSIEGKRNAQVKGLQDVQTKRAQLERRAEITKREVKEMSSELVHLELKGAPVTRIVNQLHQEIKYITIDIELKTEEKEYVKDEIESGERSAETRERLDYLTMEINKLRSQIIPIERQIYQIENKRKYLNQKRKLVEQRREVTAEINKQAELARDEEIKSLEELARLERCLQQLKEIINFRTSQGMMKKLFHNMPLKRNTKILDGANCHSTKDLEDYMTKTAELIGTDWKKLYMNLPFYPTRGNKYLEMDICTAIETEYRSSPEVQAMNSLLRWRRLHTLASVDDLKQTLRNIHRYDVIDGVENKSKPKVYHRRKSSIPEIDHGSMDRITEAVHQFMYQKGPYRLNAGKNRQSRATLSGL